MTVMFSAPAHHGDDMRSMRRGVSLYIRQVRKDYPDPQSYGPALQLYLLLPPPGWSIPTTPSLLLRIPVRMTSQLCSGNRKTD